MNTPEPTPQRIPTMQRLADELRLVNAPAAMIERAERGQYDDFKGQLATPVMQLVRDAELCGLPDIMQRAVAGEFAPEDWEGDKWARSPSGQRMFEHFFRGPAPAPGPAMRFPQKRRRTRQ